MTIVFRLDRMMAEQKISLLELADLVGMTNVNLSRIKNGRVDAIRVTTLDAICRALRCQPGDILEYAEIGTGVAGEEHRQRSVRPSDTNRSADI